MMKVLPSVLGAIFVAAGLGLFAWLCWSSWGYSGPLEYAMGLLLLGCAAFGLGLIATARPAVREALKRIWSRTVGASDRRAREDTDVAERGRRAVRAR